MLHPAKLHPTSPEALEHFDCPLHLVRTKFPSTGETIWEHRIPGIRIAVPLVDARQLETALRTSLPVTTALQKLSAASFATPLQRKLQSEVQQVCQSYYQQRFNVEPLRLNKLTIHLHRVLPYIALWCMVDYTVNPQQWWYDCQTPAEEPIEVPLVPVVTVTTKISLTRMCRNYE